MSSLNPFCVKFDIKRKVTCNVNCLILYQTWLKQIYFDYKKSFQIQLVWGKGYKARWHLQPADLNTAEAFLFIC